MIDHETAGGLLSDYLDGELSPQQERELEAHLEGCPKCTDELEELRQTLDTLGSLKSVSPPTEFVGKIQQRINKRSRGRFFGQESLLVRIPFEWISFVIIMLLLVMYIMTVAQHTPEVKAPPPSEQQKVQRPIPAQPGGAPARRPGDLSREKVPPK